MSSGDRWAEHWAHKAAVHLFGGENCFCSFQQPFWRSDIADCTEKILWAFIHTCETCDHVRRRTSCNASDRWTFNHQHALSHAHTFNDRTEFWQNSTFSAHRSEPDATSSCQNLRLVPPHRQIRRIHGLTLTDFKTTASKREILKKLKFEELTKSIK